MTRKDFLQKLSLGTTGIVFSAVLSRCMQAQKKGIKFFVSGANAKVGHILREKKVENLNISHTEKQKILIIGAGASGLTAAYFLQKKGINAFQIVELDKKIGGNSQNGENQYSKYPYGAHYLPIPNTENRALLDFLVEKKIITGFNTENLPIYNEQDLCFDPEERLLVNQYWQEGIVPNMHLSAQDKKDIDRFFALVKELKVAKGEDKKFVFHIPIAEASQTNEWRKLDNLSFETYLKQENYTSEKLFWYLNYCCRDDYGQGIKHVSAFAGLHYFASRKGKGANCEENAVLTWSEGNAHLVNLLAESLHPQIKTSQLVREIEIIGNTCKSTIYDVEKDKYYCVESEKIILAVPYFVRKKLLAKVENPHTTLNFTHQPWLISNITLKNFSDKHGFPLAWDNVLMNSETLGFVYAQHQSLRTTEENFVFTLYKPLDKGEEKEIRLKYYSKTEEALKQEILADMKEFYANIEQDIEEIDCHIWGHGMISPSINFLLNPEKNALCAPIQQKIFFAHTDYSGISLFEEAFWQGKKAVEEILNT